MYARRLAYLSKGLDTRTIHARTRQSNTVVVLLNLTYLLTYVGAEPPPTPTPAREV